MFWNSHGSEKLPDIKPGQFVQVRVDGSPETFLRRPISVHDVNYGTNTLKTINPGCRKRH